MHIENLLDYNWPATGAPTITVRQQAKDIFKDFENFRCTPHLDTSFNTMFVSFSANDGNYCYAFQLGQVLGNCGMLTLAYFEVSRLRVNVSHDKIGENRIAFLAKIIELCKLMGYTQLITTVNSAGEKLDSFVTFGFKRIPRLEFNNRRTGSNIRVLGYLIHPKNVFAGADAEEEDDEYEEEYEEEEY